LPGEPRIGQYGRDPECGGTNRRYYDEMYGTAGRVMSVDEMRQHESRAEIIRCGACGQNKVICWLKTGVAVNPSAPRVPTETPSPQIPPGTKHIGPNDGIVCPNGRSPEQAAAAGCRWLGNRDGYDICANPNWYRYPQCVASGGGQEAPGRLPDGTPSPASRPRLQGRVEENVGTPPEAPSGPFVDLANALNELAPHYDMMRPHEGLRVISDIVTGMGLGYLVKGLGFGLKSVMGKLTGKAIQGAAETPPPIRSWAPAGGSLEPPRTAGPKLPTQGAGGGLPTQAPVSGQMGGSFPAGAVIRTRTLPPGVRVPDVLLNTPRPVHLQQTPMSCGLACIKMVSETVERRSLPEAFYRQISRGGVGVNPGGYNPSVGTQMANLADVMRKARLKATMLSGQTIDDIAAATKSGYPAIVRVGNQTSGHFVVVDAVVGSPGNRYLFIRDPANLAHANAATQQLLVDSGFSNMPVYSEQEFANVFGGGFSIFVGL
jgi:hypothetical protein